MNIVVKILKFIQSRKRLIISFWSGSKDLCARGFVRSRVAGFLDLVRCYLLYGSDYSNYVCFKFYELNSCERNKFVTFYRNESLWKKLCGRKVQKDFLDKVFFNSRFANFVKRDWIDTKNMSEDAILEFIGKYDSVIVKPTDSCMGIGVYKIICCEQDKVNELMVAVKKGSRFIIEETLENVSEIKALNPPSLNTIRMVTCIDNKGNYHLVAARMRMGATDACTDNVCTGGIVCAIDPISGRIDSTAKNHVGAEFAIHPNSKVDLLGYQIPQWEECLNITEKLTKVYLEARYVGWDLAITTKGIDVLEGNVPPDEGVTQMNHEVGLWLDFKKWM